MPNAKSFTRTPLRRATMKCPYSWSTIKTRHPEWVKGRQVNILVQAALKKDPDLDAVPLATDLAANPEQRQILKVLLASQLMARPFVAPPGTQARRVLDLLRERHPLIICDSRAAAEEPQPGRCL